MGKDCKVKLELIECFKILLCSTLCSVFARQGLWNLVPSVPPSLSEAVPVVGRNVSSVQFIPPLL